MMEEIIVLRRGGRADNVAVVDVTYGTTGGAVGDGSRPFSTIQGACDAIYAKGTSRTSPAAILLGPGTHALGNSKIVMPYYTSLIGSGRYTTRITSAFNLNSGSGYGPIVIPASFSTVANLSIIGTLDYNSAGTPPADNYQAPIGWYGGHVMPGDPSPPNYSRNGVIVENCYMWGGSDVVYINESAVAPTPWIPDTYALGANVDSTTKTYAAMTSVSGNFVFGQAVTQATSNAAGYVLSWKATGATLCIAVTSGTFDSSHVVSQDSDPTNIKATPAGAAVTGDQRHWLCIADHISNADLSDAPWASAGRTYWMPNDLPNMEIRNCLLEGTYDALAVYQRYSRVVCRNVRTILQHDGVGGHECRGVVVNAASSTAAETWLRAYGCHFIARGSPLQNYGASVLRGTLEMYNCIASGSDGPSSYDLFLSGTSTLKVDPSCQFDPSKCSGTITPIGGVGTFTATSDPQDATAGNRPKAAYIGQRCIYSGDEYFCTTVATPVWKKVTSA